MSLWSSRYRTDARPYFFLILSELFTKALRIQPSAPKTYSGEELTEKIFPEATLLPS